VGKFFEAKFSTRGKKYAGKPDCVIKVISPCITVTGRVADPGDLAPSCNKCLLKNLFAPESLKNLFMN
jgi:hypothetical protein